MQEKQMPSRFQQKRDIEANWIKATNFIPKAGEVIVYSAEKESDELPTGRDYYIKEARLKIGDGVTNVTNLKFILSDTLGNVKAALDKIHNIQNVFINSVPNSGGDINTDTEVLPIALYDGGDLSCMDSTVSLVFDGSDLDEGGSSK